MDNVLLSVEECYRADRLAARAGVASLALMEAAGAGVARHIMRRWRARPVSVLCGPGNNGGDGYVVARYLAEAGWPVRVAQLGVRAKLKGDAAANAKRWTGPVEALGMKSLAGCSLVVDALFGAGLARPIEGVPYQVIEAINERGIDCVGIDVPSGVHGDTGEIMGIAPRCRLSVTFFRPKPGLFLLPGRVYAGDVAVVGIGIPKSVLDDIKPQTYRNRPALWLASMPRPGLSGNKYTRGHVVIAGGPEMTGAARLAARGARRAGAGLATICCDPEAFPIYAAGDPGTIAKPVSDAAAFADVLKDPRRNVVVVGPGAGVSPETRHRVLAALQAKKQTVLDADALSVFENDPETLLKALHPACVLTPHEGEFKRVFPDVRGGKLARARAAARLGGATVLLKGGDTVVAVPAGDATITDNAPAVLATAGSGDVLSGLIAGLLAQGMAPFEAASAACWIHGEAARSFGVGLIAEDIPELLPPVLAALERRQSPKSP
ncbi:MAG: NAD(P)H-hydrate dehydratase [Rhodospirillales bacterium]